MRACVCTLACGCLCGWVYARTCGSCDWTLDYSISSFSGMLGAFRTCVTRNHKQKIHTGDEVCGRAAAGGEAAGRRGAGDVAGLRPEGHPRGESRLHHALPRCVFFRLRFAFCARSIDRSMGGLLDTYSLICIRSTVALTRFPNKHNNQCRPPGADARGPGRPRGRRPARQEEGGQAGQALAVPLQVMMTVAVVGGEGGGGGLCGGWGVSSVGWRVGGLGEHAMIAFLDFFS